MKAVLKKSVTKETDERKLSVKNESTMLDNNESSHESDEHVNVDEDLDEHDNDAGESGVIDLSSSGFCSWCHKPGPCSILSDSEIVGGKRLRKRYCSERCFGLQRRAMFKKNRRCDWCHKVLSDEKDHPEQKQEFQFCSDICKARFIGERTMTTSNPENKGGVSDNQHAGLGPPPTSSLVEAAMANVNFPLNLVTGTGSGGQLPVTGSIGLERLDNNQAAWMARVHAFLRAEEDRRRQQEMLNFLLANHGLDKLPGPEEANRHARNLMAPTAAKRRKLGGPPTRSDMKNVPTVNRLPQNSTAISTTTATSSNSAAAVPPPLTPAPRLSRSEVFVSPPTVPSSAPSSSAKPPIQTKGNTATQSSGLINMPPPTMVLPMPFFIPLPIPIPLPVPIPMKTSPASTTSPPLRSPPSASPPAPRSQSQNNLEENSDTIEADSNLNGSNEALDEQRRRRRALIIDKPSNGER